MNEVNDSDLKNLPEMATLTVKPFVLSPKTCPKCGRGPLRFKAGRDGIGGTLEKPGTDGQGGEWTMTATEKRRMQRQLHLEVNWGWDPKKGSLPFKRLRATPKNIRDQQRIARPGTLIHWAGKPCARGTEKTDEHTETHSTASGSISSVTHGALASHIGNINCLKCRQTFFALERKRTAEKRTRDPHVTRDLLLLVGIRVSLFSIRCWSRNEVEAAKKWAAKMHLYASDNIVRVPPKPEFLKRYEKVAA